MDILCHTKLNVWETDKTQIGHKMPKDTQTGYAIVKVDGVEDTEQRAFNEVMSTMLAVGAVGTISVDFKYLCPYCEDVHNMTATFEI